MSRVDALDVVVTSVGSKVGAGSTAATSTNQWGEVNVSGVLLGGAQVVHSVMDLSSKGLQATSASTWGRAVPGVGAFLVLRELGLLWMLALTPEPTTQVSYRVVWGLWPQVRCLWALHQ